ncbi:uncharacterized protein LOC114533007 [Dendronephthya gigantea]|uniref:uncharacterized protein LOC114533007 n=1 Tax=Dendronephthya gigantea TaxID=151771 RepID=UPI00106BA64F|nr:uncharacterized protein LOC114533007 [Dendronephthya gigantea]
MTASKDVEFELQRFWELDSIGIRSDQKDDTSEFLLHYQDTSISLKDGKYHAKLPWKPEQPILPSNVRIAQQRTRSMVKRLAADPEKLMMYNDVIVNQCNQGFIEKVENPSMNTGTCHYLPHHAVFKESSTTPLRVVYDCSCSTSNQPSLNDCLVTGPPILNDLTAILLRFRRQKYGMTADIEKAFLNIVLNEEDRDATRFFWLSDPKDPNSAFEVYRFKRVLFGATSSPFILNATLDKHLKQFNHPVAEHIREDIYVDDLVLGAQNNEEAIAFYTNARTLMSPGGFNLRSWSSNNETVKTIAAGENLLNDNPKPKVLGMKWDTTDDTLLYSNNVTVSEADPTTKREVLRTSSKIYDPLGFLNPVVVNSKILMQEIWKTGLQWDELLPPEMQERWNNIAKELEASTSVQVPRQYFPSTNNLPEDTELHVFVDASLKAYKGRAATYTSASVIRQEIDNSTERESDDDELSDPNFNETELQGNAKRLVGKTNRPITKLYPLEVRAKTDDCENKDKDHAKQRDQTTQVNDRISQRPRRAAAGKAMEQIRNWIQDLRVPPEDVEND